MVQRWIDQLASADTAARRQAIMELGRSRDVSALPALAEVYKNDPSGELRELARKAGMYIRRETATSAPPPAPRRPSPAAPPIYNDDDDDGDPSLDAVLGRSANPPASGSRRPASPPPSMRDDDDDPSLDAILGAGAIAGAGIVESALTDAPAGRSGRPKGAVFFNDDQTSAKPSAAESVDDRLDGRLIPVRGREYSVPKENRERAKRYLESALSANLNDNNAQAIKDLTQAISLDPNLINDTYFNNILASVTGAEGDQALAILFRPQEREKLKRDATRSHRQKQVEAHLETVQETTWADFGFEMTIYFLIMTFAPVLLVLIVSETLLGFGSGAIANSTNPADAVAVEQLREMQLAFSGFTLVILVPLAIGSAFNALVGFLGQMAIVHLVARFLLGGNGTWRHLFTVLLRFYNRFLPLIFLSVGVTFVALVLSLLTPVVFCLTLVPLGLTLFVLGKTSQKIGEAYGFGAIKGCLSLILAQAVISFTIGGFLFLIVQSLGLAFNAFFGV